uniref:Uncharacterized protein n=1 Tax=Rousettus aegyptiacus TaxID=9407 RepID=A0A7J8BSG6_ROUAE|nr:hypothetical protein HJG63_009511 [Rousettus aegyptiacus]
MILYSLKLKGKKLEDMCGKYVSFILSPSSFPETVAERSRLPQLPTDGKSAVGTAFPLSGLHSLILHSSELLKHRRAHIFTRPANPDPLVTREDSCGRRAEAPCSRTPWAQSRRRRVPAAGPHLALPGGSESPACTSRKFVAWPETERRQVIHSHEDRTKPQPPTTTHTLLGLHSAPLSPDC